MPKNCGKQSGKHASPLGYFSNANNSCFIAKLGVEEEAKTTLAGTGVRITTGRNRHLGAAVGSHEFSETYIKALGDERVREIKKLSTMAET